MAIQASSSSRIMHLGNHSSSETPRKEFFIKEWINKLSRILILLLLAIGIYFIILSIPNNSVKDAVNKRDNQRTDDVNKISRALEEYMAEIPHAGQFPQGLTKHCPDRQKIGRSGYDLGFLLVPKYLPKIPVDPLLISENDTGYEICIAKPSLYRINIYAPKTEAGPEIYSFTSEKPLIY